MAGKGKATNHRDLDEPVFCSFKNVLSVEAGEQLTKSIETLIGVKNFDKTGLMSCVGRRDGNNQMRFTRGVANSIRDRLAMILSDSYTSVWFSICTNPFHSLFNRTLADNDEKDAPTSSYQASCHFGALQSYDRFYSHESFNNKILQLAIQNENHKPHSLRIQLNQQQKIIVPIASIQKKNVLVNNVNKNQGVYILFSLKYTPRMIITEPPSADHPNGRARRFCNDQDCPEMIREIAMCSDLVLHFAPLESMPWLFLQQLMPDSSVKSEINFSVFTVSDWSSVRDRHRPPDPFDYKNASFKDRYALQMLTSSGYVFRDKWAQLTDRDLRWNEWNPKDRYDLCCYALEQLRKDHAFDLRRTAEEYDQRRSKTEKAQANQVVSTVFVKDKNRLEVATCTLTPMRVIFQPLEVTSGSRALRNPVFKGPKNFLLVHFREEDNEDLRASDSRVQDFLIKKMLDGIESLGRSYKFMGASTGQLKEMAFWFVDLPPEFTSMTEAHNKLGNFGEITNIATYIARVGQYFSTTWPLDIQLTKVSSSSEFRPNTNQCYATVIPDEKRNGRCFTDGVGQISWGLAGRVALRMGIQLFSKEDIPSAFQVRVAGCKGMLAIDPQSTLDDYYIRARESMVKFTSDDWSLEICEIARPITLTFNNQVIRLLKDLGNPDIAFERFQTIGLNHWQVPEEQQSSIIDIGLQKNVAYSKSKTNLLKNRIPVASGEGRNLFGVVDDTRTLEYGQCFIQYSSLESRNDGQKKYHVVTGTVLVTKNPCMWPGDFRRLTAVANSKLKECMRDVIVFPMNGPRPHPNEISGSDLDGDQYWVYWGDQLKIKEEAEPLNYGSSAKAEVSNIDQNMIVDHIVKTFGAGGVVGMISNIHTVAADRSPEHSFTPACKELAELFSIAIDAPKTGKTVDKKELRPYQRKYSSKYPHFMMKPDESTYESDSILEKLFFEGREQYFRLNETPSVDVYSPTIKPKKDQPGRVIQDADFKRWIEANGGEGVVEPKKPADKGRKKPAAARPQSPIEDTEEPSPDEPKAPVVRKKTAAEPTAQAKKDLATEKTGVLINTEASASANSSLSASLFADDQPCHVDLILAVNIQTSVQTNVQYSPMDQSLVALSLKADKAGAPDINAINVKLASYLEKQPIFKPRSTKYDANQHGPLSLVVSYGRIGFVARSPLPEKLGELQRLIETQHDQLIRFSDALIDELNFDSKSASAMKKSAINYELECRLSPTSNESVSLQFDSTKTLKRICVSHVWAKCYLRQPYSRADSVYEIRSVKTIQPKSTEFPSITTALFQSPFDAKLKLLGGRKPNIEIDRGLLQPSVVVTRLTIIDGEQSVEIDGSGNEATYREVMYPSIQEPVERGKPPVRLEYDAPLIDNKSDYLQRICRHALSPTENRP